jgi:hypothetical protein
MSTEDNKEIAQMPEDDLRFEAFMTVLENASLPWYVRTTELYNFLKCFAEKYAGVVSTKLSEPVYEKFLETINALVEKLKTATAPYFTYDQGIESLIKIDNVLNALCAKIDSNVSCFRVQLAIVLRNLRKAVKEHCVKFAVALKEGCTKAEEMHMKVHQEVTTQSLHLWQLIFGMKKIATDTTVQYIEGSKQKLGSMIVDAKEVSICKTQEMLQTARPYVQQAVVISKPYVEKAVVVSQPYVEKAYPYMEPLATKAVDCRTKMEANEKVGPYVSHAIIATEKVVENVKSYCFDSIEVVEPVEAAVEEPVEDPVEEPAGVPVEAAVTSE